MGPMRVLVFSDIHGDLKALEKLLDIEADHYFAAGDMVSWSKGLDKAGKILSRRAARMHVLPGNHETAEAIHEMCERFSLDAFHGRSFQSGGYQFAGLGYSNPTPFNTPGEYSEQEIAARLGLFENLDPLVLVCHAPPRDTLLDRTSNGHIGSPAVREFIERRQPRYFFCGHVHEAAGQEDKIGVCRAYNAGKQGRLLQLDKIES